MFTRGNIRNAIIGKLDPPINYDGAAISFIDCLRINEGVNLSWSVRNALNNLIKRMKGLDPLYGNYGNATIWNAGILFCPNVGNSLNTAKYNLFNAQNTDAAKRQTYTGGVTFQSGYGVKGDGINGRIRTFVHQRNDGGLSPTSATIGAVYKDNQLTGRMDFGCYGSSTAVDANLWLRIINSGSVSILCRNYTYEGTALTSPTTQAGHWCLKNGSLANRPQLYYNKTKIFEHSGTPDYSFLNESREFTTAGANGEITFLCLNYNQGTFTNFCSNTLILYYVMKDIGAYITQWNDMIEAFCIETSRKTW